jgi:hypothetical protein
MAKMRLVRLAGIEPTTLGFGVYKRLRTCAVLTSSM